MLDFGSSRVSQKNENVRYVLVGATANAKQRKHSQGEKNCATETRYVRCVTRSLRSHLVCELHACYSRSVIFYTEFLERFTRKIFINSDSCFSVLCLGQRGRCCWKFIMFFFHRVTSESRKYLHAVECDIKQKREKPSSSVGESRIKTI